MMLRRYAMMAAQKVDLLEGYRLNHNSGYRVNVSWKDNNTLRAWHTTSGFMGPNYAAVCFIGNKTNASTGYGAALLGVGSALTTLEYGKKYKLTLTVLEITKNTATTDNDGNLKVALGRGGGSTTSYATYTTIKFSELEVGTKIEVIKAHSNTTYPITSACIEVSNSALLWDITFKVEFEEVK